MNEVKVDLLRRNIAIYEYKQIRHLLTMENIVVYHIIEALLIRFAAFGVAVAREIHQIPLIINKEVAY